jgi:hypothetical protein
MNTVRMVDMTKKSSDELHHHRCPECGGTSDGARCCTQYHLGCQTYYDCKTCDGEVSR